MTPLSRRGFLSAVGGLTLPGLLRLRAAAPTRDTAVIFIQLGGGPPQHETYDPKPDAPAEYRGAFASIPTAVPGVRFCELMPKQAALMKRLAVVRSVAHHEASHIALHAIETGYFLRASVNALRGEMPSMSAIVSRAAGRGGELPAAVEMPKAFAYSGTHYLGGQYAPFAVTADPNDPAFAVANLGLPKGVAAAQIADRRALLRGVDVPLPADPDGGGAAIDRFRQKAFDLVTGPKARAAFDIAAEPAKLRDRYGRNPLGQRCLLARRLVEAGVPLVTVRTADWDDHQDLPGKMKARAPAYDAAVAALVEDLADRGRDRDVLVVAMGEFGRTPRVNPNAGRDHWPGAASVLLAGGGLRVGRAVGATDSKGAAVTAAPYPPQSILATAYRHLGVDPAATFPDFAGRPRHVLEDRDPVRELA